MSRQGKQCRADSVPGGPAYIGTLFRNRSGTNDKKELLVFVTPKIVREELTASVH